MINQSAIEWSPGFRIGLRSLGRLSVAFAGSKYWLVGYAFLYAVYAVALVGEVLEARLPHMDMHEVTNMNASLHFSINRHHHHHHHKLLLLITRSPTFCFLARRVASSSSVTTRIAAAGAT